MAILVRNLFIFFIVLSALIMGGLSLRIEQRLPERDYSEFLQDLNGQQITEIDFTGNKANITLKSGFRYSARVPDVASLAEKIPLSTTRVTFHEDYTLYYFQGGLFALALALAFIVWLSISAKKTENGSNKFATDKLISAWR